MLTGQKNLVQLKEQLPQQLQQWTALKALRANLISEVDDTTTKLATETQDSEARKAAIAKLRADLAALDKQTEALQASAQKPTPDGNALRSHMGEGNRQYLTGLRMGGKHVVILVDTSTSMLDRTIVNIIRRRNMSPEQQRQAPKWKQLVNTVDWITTQIEQGTQIQIFGFTDKAVSLLPGSNGKWVTVTDGKEVDAAVSALRAQYPKGPHEPARRVRGRAVDGSEARQRLSADRRPADDGRDRADSRRRHGGRAARSLQPRGSPAADRRAREHHPVRDGRRSAGRARVLGARAAHRRLDARAVGGLAMRRRREFEIFTMSFLDAICCGFGAMILLFIVTPRQRAGEARGEQDRSARA